MRNYFTDLLDGVPMTFADLIENNRGSYRSQAPAVLVEDVMNVLPCLHQLQLDFRRSTSGKAIGEDTLQDTILKKHPRLLAVARWPLHVKAYCKLDPPVQWR
eukprot:11759813-Karenia_brevis.AAC.1